MTYIPPRDNVLCMSGAGLTKAALLRATFSLSWHMPTPQVFALHRLSLQEGIEVSEEFTELALPQSKLTLFGIPVTVDNSLPDSVVELRSGDRRVYTIDNIGIPNEFWRAQ